MASRRKFGLSDIIMRNFCRPEEREGWKKIGFIKRYLKKKPGPFWKNKVGLSNEKRKKKQRRKGGTKPDV